MVQVKESATGSYDYQLGGSAGNYASYSFLPNIYEGVPQQTTPNNGRYSEKYLARNLKTTNLGTGSLEFKPRYDHSYGMRGQVHQGQQRTGLFPQYVLPEIKSAPHSRSETHTTDFRKSEIKLTKAIRSALALTSLADRTAGMPTLPTSIYRGGIGRKQAASRAAVGSIVKSIGLLQTSPQHAGMQMDTKMTGNHEEKEKKKRLLVPYGHEVEHYTELERMKKMRMLDSYHANLQKHKTKREFILKHKLAVADKIRKKKIQIGELKQNVPKPEDKKIKINIRINLHDDQETTETQKTDAKIISSNKYFLSHSGLGSAARAWKNIPKSYLNVWNQKVQAKTE